MKNSIIVSAAMLFVLQMGAQNNDSLSIKNKQAIEALKDRLNNVDKIDLGSNTFQKQIDDLKAELTRQNDSVTKLLTIINDLKKFAPSNLPEQKLKTSLSINAKGEHITTKSLSDNDYNVNSKSDSDIQNYISSCNCSPLFYKPYQVQLNFKTISDLNELIKNYEANSKHKIVIVGHADKSGNEDRNINLSKQRAENLKSYLIIASDKIKKEDIVIEWVGSSKPIPNLPENKKELNRRTEIILE